LQLLQERGYGRLTLDDVVSVAHVSKATVYRRWPSKAELVLAAFIEGTPEIADPPNSGTLRGDLLWLGHAICKHARKHASTIRAVLVELPRNAALNEAVQRHFIEQRKILIKQALRRAVDRGEIDEDAISEELCDLLPGYLTFRAAISDQAPTRRTVEALVDTIFIPTLTRSTIVNA
jgi:AcrR family transcriptional regulator